MEPLDGGNKDGPIPQTIVDDASDSPKRETNLSFLHSTKQKADSFL